MKIQILRKGSKYCIRAKFHIFWHYYDGALFWGPICRWLGSFCLKWYPSYADAKYIVEQIEARHIKDLVEDGSPVVVEDEQTL